MTKANIMLVEYVGNKPKKTDNVLNSGVIWNGKGDVKEVAYSVGNLLTQNHPDIWAEHKGAKSAEPAENEKIVPVVEGALSLEEIEALGDVKVIRKHLKDVHQITFKGKVGLETVLKKAAEVLKLPIEKDESLPHVFNGVEVTKELEPLLPMAEAGGFSTNPEQAVSQAIDMLGGPKSGYFNEQTGLPHLEVIQLLVGEAATMARIDTVMMNRLED